MEISISLKNFSQNLSEDFLFSFFLDIKVLDFRSRKTAKRWLHQQIFY